MVKNVTGEGRLLAYRRNESLGCGAKALCIEDEETHRSRLAAAKSLAMQHIKEVPANKIVVDLGAGFFDLYGMLKGTQLDALYVGVEEQQWMVDEGLKVASEKGWWISAERADASTWLSHNGESVFVVFMLGVLATCTEDDAHELARKVKESNARWLIASWLPADMYEGAFQAWSTEQIEELFGEIIDLAIVEGEATGIFRYE